MFKKYGSALSHASQKFNRLIINGFIENGCEVEALSQRVYPIGISDDYPVYRGTDVIHFTILPSKKNKKLNRISTIFNAFCEIKKWKKQNPDGIAVCDTVIGELSLGLILARFFTGIKTVSIVTDIPTMMYGSNRRGLRALPGKIKKKAISFYDGYIFLTEQMNVLLNSNRRPYTIVEGVADPDVVKEPNTLEAKHPEKICMMAGLLSRVFGVDMLIEAFKQVKNDDARLHFYGNGDYVEEIKKASETDPRIRYCGELTNAQIVAEEKKATLLINPRIPNGDWTKYSFPSKNMEYMASGTPLIACDLPCIPDEYKPYFFEITPVSVEGLATLLQKLFDTDRGEIHNFGMKAQQWIIDNKTPAKLLKTTVDMINKF